MSNNCFLTTTDNPYNPFTHFDQWYTYDMDKGYNTCGLVSSLSKTNDSLSDELNDEIVEDSYDEILALFPNVLGFENVHYKKVYEKDFN